MSSAMIILALQGLGTMVSYNGELGMCRASLTSPVQICSVHPYMAD